MNCRLRRYCHSEDTNKITYVSRWSIILTLSVSINIILSMDKHQPIDEFLSSLSASSYRWIFIIIILPLDHHYPTNGSSTLSYQWIKIVPSEDIFHYYNHYINGSTSSNNHHYPNMDQHHPINGSKPFYRWSFIMIIFQWINIILPMDHQHYHTNGSASSYKWSSIILSMF